MLPPPPTSTLFPSTTLFRSSLTTSLLEQAKEQMEFAKPSNQRRGRGEQGKCGGGEDRKSTRLNSSHLVISYAVFCLKKKKKRPARREVSLGRRVRVAGSCGE